MKSFKFLLLQCSLPTDMIMQLEAWENRRAAPPAVATEMTDAELDVCNSMLLLSLQFSTTQDLIELFNDDGPPPLDPADTEDDGPPPLDPADTDNVIAHTGDGNADTDNVIVVADTGDGNADTDNVMLTMC